MILVTGAAGFIGFHLARRLLREGETVTGMDNLNDYYDVSLKEARLGLLREFPRFSFHRIDLSDRAAMEGLFRSLPGNGETTVVHLAAQAGVRYSLVHPRAYTESNISGFLNVLEGCRALRVRHLVFASSSSVYGGNTKMPFSVHDNVDHPVSLYAATKKANELMAHAYAVLFGIPSTGLRFFTVYGPWGRPDMALFLFTRAILDGKPVDLYNYGRMKRDFTYIDDIIEGVVRVMQRIPEGKASPEGSPPDPGTSFAPYRIFNIGNGTPVDLMEFLGTLERILGRTTEKNLLPIQPGDVEATFADVADLARETGFRPRTPVEEGIGRFVDWYLSYYGGDAGKGGSPRPD